MPLVGDHQIENAVTVLAAIEVLIEQGVALSRNAIVSGFGQVVWPCRMEVLRKRPLVMADGAHNPYSAAQLREAVRTYVPEKRVILVCGVSGGKNMEGIAAELAPLASRVIATRSRHPRSLHASEVASAFRGCGSETIEAVDVSSALGIAMRLSGKDPLILVTGSLFVAAEAREFFKRIKGEAYPDFQVCLAGSKPTL
jgi:dihydrofolate synthase/folylpolyglutamate synthase